MANDLEQQALDFAQRIFDDVRAMSATELGVTRQGYGPKETEVLAYLRKVGEGLGLSASTDAAGNLWMRLPGTDPALPALVSGSHADSVPEGGNFDGLAGIVAALTAAWWVKASGVALRRDFVVAALRCEESSFYGKAYVGSLSLTGQLTKADLALKHRSGKTTLGECMRACGVDTDAVTAGKPLVDLKRIAAFLELHIEQGPMLDGNAAERVGIVTGIRGNIRHKCVRCLGQTAHSGAVDKPYRHDAVMATADLLHRMDVHWDEWLQAGNDLVFTVGVLKTADTAAISVIPGETSFTVDMRSLSLETARGFHDLLQQEASAVARERGVTFEFDTTLTTRPSQLSAQLGARLAEAASACGVAARTMPSGAGHDSAVMSNAGVPTAMIFVANQHGSHNPYEAMQMADFMLGAKVLWTAVTRF